MRRAFIFSPLFSVALLLLAISAAAAERCAPPPDLKPKLTATPSVETLNDLGVWFAQHDEFTCAAQAFASSLQTDLQQPDLPRIVFEFGAALFFSGDTAGSITALQQAETLGYRDLKLHEMLATALDAQHSTQDAIEEWRKALTFDPDAALQLDSLSTDLIAVHQYQQAVDLLEQPRVRPYRTVTQYLNLGAALVELGRPESAANTLEDGLNTYPSSAKLAHQLAAVLTSLHRDDDAALVLRLATEEQTDPAQPTE